jgi:ABC-type antimicrobial peptide transport system permease subunit
MDVLGLNLAVIVGGLLSGAIGFIMIAVVLALLLVPYMILYLHKKQETPTERRRLADDQRF